MEDISDMKIVILDGGALNPGDLDWDRLSLFGDFEIYERSKQKEIVNRAKNAELIIVNKVLITQDVLERLPSLKYIAVTATGYNNVDLNACKRLKIDVSNIVNYGSSAVAQHTFALILAITNRVQIHNQYVQQGEWVTRETFSFWDQPLIELNKKTLGIIGWGNIGQQVAKIALGFGMNVVFYSASGKTSKIASATSLESLIKRSDFISLNTHLNRDNKYLVNSTFLQMMKPTSYLINTSRGDLIKEEDLGIALKEGVIAGAALDVLSKEPPSIDHPLLGLNNCIVTPHNAWATKEARKRMMDILAVNIQSYIDGRPQNLVV